MTSPETHLTRINPHALGLDKNPANDVAHSASAIE
jgi:hypothetical protein